ncbi:MAG: type II toxin-antitoxin system RelE/ParE family toxin [Verrucomicrobiota bacterium]
MGNKSFHVIFARNSKEHLQSIAEYIAPDDPIRAISFCDELIDYALTLSKSPYKGTPYNIEGHEGLRVIGYGKRYKYLIIYKVIEEEGVVEVWAFWHGSRMPPEL